MLSLLLCKPRGLLTMVMVTASDSCCQSQINVLCRKTCLVGVLIHLIIHGKNCTSTSAWVQFFQRKIERIIQSNKTCFALITHLLSTRATTSWKMLMNNEFKADTSTGNPTRNSRCNTLASHALNMSCSFGQSARLIESRCVVTWVSDLCMQRSYSCHATIQ